MTQWGLDTIFNPAKRHMDEEKRRLQSTREEIGDSSGGKRIDLESGKVVIPRPPSAESDPDSDAEADSDEATTAAAGADDGAESSSDASTRESVAADHDVPDTLAQAAARRARERRTG